ncbi:hypothetical protein ACIQGZ_20030 [Streptomyces sp. NPDC092296]|uniref:hypothetical protein n=1 Tax=Streptomyces sp. NPDC092296 TaxID=3366012 RepID=UPI003828857C
MLDSNHRGDHMDAYGQCWPQVTPKNCVRCKQPTDGPVPVHTIERASGPAWTVYACPDCGPLLTPGTDPDR